MTTCPPAITPENPVQTIEARAEPCLESPELELFYMESLRELAALGVPFLVAGTFAVSAYTGISRPTKDLDIFCKAGDYPRILARFGDAGYAVVIKDERWLAKVFKGAYFFDVIFASSNGAIPVGDAWFSHARQVEILGQRVSLVGPTELVWSKCFVQNRDRYDGADVAHLILRKHDDIDWRRLLSHLEVHWEVLLVHLLNFRWIYPSERNSVPDWLLDELLDRVAHQRRLPAPQARICRGRLLSHADYEIDVREWGFADLCGEGAAQRDATGKEPWRKPTSR